MTARSSNEQLASAARCSLLDNVPEGAEISSVLRCLADGSFESIEQREVSHAVEVLKLIAGSGEEYCVESNSNFLAAQEVFQQNREVCLSLVRRSSDGDLDARADYQARRVSCLLLLPRYLRDEVTNVCRMAIGSIRPQLVIPKDDAMNCIGVKMWLQSKINHADQLPLLAGLPLVSTYSMGRKMSELFDAMLRSEQLIVEFSQTGARLPIDTFNPASEGPIGRVAALAFSQSIELMLASSILEDILFDIAGDDNILSLHMTPMFDTYKTQSLRNLKTPWDVHTLPLVTNMQLLADLTIAGDLHPKTTERVMGNPKHLGARNFRDIVDDINHALAAKDAKRQKGIGSHISQSSPNETSSGTTTASVKLTEKQKFFRALQGASSQEIALRDFAELHRELYSAYKRGFASLTQCLDLVRTGDTTLPPARGQWSDSLRSPSNHQPSDTRVESQEPLEKRSAHQHPEEIEQYDIVGYDSKWFQDWLSVLPQRERRLIEKRLNVARDGHFGDYTQLRGNPRLFEFRFHLGDGKRIFFSFDGDSRIVLHSAGSKKEQPRLIEAAIKDLGGG